jgi:uncharacterized membrane protein
VTAPTDSDVDTAEAPNGRMVHRLLGEWRAAELITADQAQVIEAYHRDHHVEAERSRGYSRIVAVASTLGAVLVGAGLLLVVASNWESLDALAKTVLAVAVFVIIESVGYLVRFHTGYHRTGEAILFIGTVAYGGAIFIVGQAYNRPLDDPNLFLYWLLPVVPLAYAMRSRLITALAILVFLGVVGYRMPDWIEGIGDAALVAVLTTYAMIGAALFGAGGVHRDIAAVRRLAPPWEWIGTVAILVTMYLSGFHEIYGSVPDRWISRISGTLMALVIVCGVVTAGSVVARTALRKSFDREVALTASVAGLAVVASIVFITAPFAPSGLVFGLTNLILLVTLVALLTGGIATNRQSLVNIALVVFAITVFSRYVEIGAGMFGTGTAMIVGGVLLIAMGVGLERFRRSLAARMREEAAT